MRILTCFCVLVLFSVLLFIALCEPHPVTIDKREPETTPNTTLGIYMNTKYSHCYSNWTVFFTHNTTGWEGEISNEKPANIAVPMPGLFQTRVVANGNSQLPLRPPYHPEVYVDIGCFGMITLSARNETLCDTIWWHPENDAYCPLPPRTTTGPSV